MLSVTALRGEASPMEAYSYKGRDFPQRKCYRSEGKGFPNGGCSSQEGGFPSGRVTALKGRVPWQSTFESQKVLQSRNAQETSHKRLIEKDMWVWFLCSAGNWAGDRLTQGFLEEEFSKVEISRVGISSQAQGSVGFHAQDGWGFSMISNLELGFDLLLYIPPWISVLIQGVIYSERDLCGGWVQTRSCDKYTIQGKLECGVYWEGGRGEGRKRARLGWGERGETEAEGERQERERQKVASSEKTAERKRVGVDRVFLLKRPFASTYRLRLNRSGYCLGASYQMTRQASMQLKFNCTYM